MLEDKKPRDAKPGEMETPRLNNPSTSEAINIHQVESIVYRQNSLILTEKLIDAIQQDQVRTSGQIDQWCWQLWKLPRDLKSVVWIRLSETISHDVFQELHRGYKSYSDAAAGNMIAKRDHRGRS
jgi:hypothetical protein